MKTPKLLEDNPLISLFVIAAVLGGTITAGITGLGQLDDLVMTKAEHDIDLAIHASGFHVTAAKAIENLQAWNRCDRLERRSSELADRQWRLEQTAGTAALTLRDVGQDIEQIKQKFTDLKCSVVLSSG